MYTLYIYKVIREYADGTRGEAHQDIMPVRA